MTKEDILEAAKEPFKQSSEQTDEQDGAPQPQPQQDNEAPPMTSLTDLQKSSTTKEKGHAMLHAQDEAQESVRRTQDTSREQ